MYYMCVYICMYIQMWHPGVLPVASGSNLFVYIVDILYNLDSRGKIIFSQNYYFSNAFSVIHWHVKSCAVMALSNLCTTEIYLQCVHVNSAWWFLHNRFPHHNCLFGPITAGQGNRGRRCCRKKWKISPTAPFCSR